MACFLSLGLENAGRLNGRLPEPGCCVDRWQIEHPMASGGMGALFKAREVDSGRPVVLKFLTPQLASDEIYRMRFELESSHHLTHPHIVPVLASGSENELPYLVMPYYAGGSLSQWIRVRWGGPGQIAWRSAERMDDDYFRRVASLVQCVAAAVGHAHQHGILHRDIKPSNVLMDEAGHVHLGDFGVGRRVALEERLTASNAVWGTPGYMAPEVAEGASPEGTVAGDIYGCGAVLMELLTGEPPHAASNPMATLHRTATQSPGSPRLQNHAVPIALDLICRKSLCREPASRYRSGEEFAEDLRRFLNHEPILARSESAFQQLSSWARHHPRLAVMGVCCALLLLLSAMVSTWQWKKASDAHVAALAATEEERRLIVSDWIARGMTALAENRAAESLAWLAAAWRSDATASITPTRASLHSMRFELALRQLPVLDRVVSLDQGIDRLAADPSSGWAAAAVRPGGLSFWRLGAAPFEPARMTVDASVLHAAFTPGLARLAVLCVGASNQYTLQTIDPNTRTMLGSIPVSQESRDFVISPDGRFVTVLGTSRSGECFVWNLATGQRSSPLLKHGDRVSAAVWLADGRLATGSWDGTVRVWDWAKGTVDLQWRSAEFVRVLACSKEGRWLAYGSDDSTVRIIDLASGKERFKLPHAGWISALVAHPDGTQLATCDFRGNLRLWNATSGEPVSAWIETGEAGNRRMMFSPDGRFLSHVGGSRIHRIWRVSPRVEVESTLPAAAYEQAPVWVGSNQFLVATPVGTCQTWSLNPTPGSRIFPASGVVQEVAASRDGNWLAAVIGNDRFHLFDAHASEARASDLPHPGQVFQVEFNSNDGTLLSASREGLVRLWDPGHPSRPLREIRTAERLSSAEFSKDGQWLVLGSGAGEVQLWPVGSNEIASVGGPARRWKTRALGETLAAISPDSRYVAAGVSPRNHVAPESWTAEGAWLWRVDSGEPVVHALPVASNVSALGFDRSGSQVAIGLWNGDARIFRARDGAPMTPWLRHPMAVRETVFNAAGSICFTVGHDGTVRAWDTASGRLIRSEFQALGAILTAELSPDGASLLAGASDGSMALWDAASLEPLLPRVRNQDPLRFCRFDPGGQRIFYGGLRQIHELTLPSPRLTLRTAETWERAVAPFEVRPDGRPLEIRLEQAVDAWKRLALER